MLPLFDENPTTKRPYVTWALIALSIIIYLLPSLDRTPQVIDTDFFIGEKPYLLDDDVRFALKHAAVPCEIIQRRPLSEAEVHTTYYQSGDGNACDSEDQSNPVFGSKHVLLAIVSSIFLHGSFFHLAVNMLFLWVFGNNVEQRLGKIGFGLFYLCSGIVATVAYVAFQPTGTVAILGASGAVAGVMGSYLIWYPDAPIRTLVFLVLVDIRARWFLAGWFALQFFTWRGPGAWIAHVSGFVFGVIAGRIVRKLQPRLRLRPGQRAPKWDETGGAGHGPYPHLDEVWIEPHHERYD